MPVHHTIHAYVASEEFYPNGSVIIEEGTVGDWVYVILEGSAKVRKKTSKGLVTVDTLKEGDVFGEMGFLEGGKRLRSASVVASGDVWNDSFQSQGPDSIPCPEAQGNHHECLLPCLSSGRKVGSPHKLHVFLEVAQKRSDTRRPKSRGVRRTVQYVARTRDEGNAGDGRFSATC